MEFQNLLDAMTVTAGLLALACLYVERSTVKSYAKLWLARAAYEREVLIDGFIAMHRG